MPTIRSARCAIAFVVPEGVIYLDGQFARTDAAGCRKHASSHHRAGMGAGPDQELEFGRMVRDAAAARRSGRCADRRRTGQSVVCDTTSINLYKAVQAAIGLRPDRDMVIAEAASFPTDLYIIEGAIGSAGRPMQRRLVGADSPSLEALLDDRVAVVVLSHVDYRSGALLDVAGITEQVHKAGALMVWDLCHSAGVVEIGFDRNAIDFAVGCTYKYLNGAPGRPPSSRSQKRIRPQQGIRCRAGGPRGAFAFDRDFRPDAGIKRFLCGTPPIISLRGVEAALDALEGVEVAALRAKSLALRNCSWRGSLRSCPVLRS